MYPDDTPITGQRLYVQGLFPQLSCDGYAIYYRGRVVDRGFEDRTAAKQRLGELLRRFF